MKKKGLQRKRRAKLSHFDSLLLVTDSSLLHSLKGAQQQKRQAEAAQKHIPPALLQATDHMV